jgi:hypothetical protein
MMIPPKARSLGATPLTGNDRDPRQCRFDLADVQAALPFQAEARLQAAVTRR